MNTFGLFRSYKFSTLAGALIVGLGAAACSESVDAPEPAGEVTQAAHVEPILITGNATCGDLSDEFGDGKWIECKIEPVSSGTYTDAGDFQSNSELCAQLLEIELAVYMTDDGQEFDWESNRGIDAVFVKGGPNGNLYLYDPAATSDTGLHSPLCPSGDWCGLSHISFCLELNVDVTKTAVPTFTRTHEWEIDKSVNPEQWDLFRGDKATSDYEVKVEAVDYEDSDFAVSGVITIVNNTPITATIESVTDELNGIFPDVDCGVTFPYELEGFATLECTYSANLPDGTSLTNTATVETSGQIGGNTAEAAVVFGDPTTEVNETITVVDTNVAGDLGTCSANDDGSCTFPYSLSFECDEDEGTHPNTATIVETGQNDSASVVVNCYELIVTKDATASFGRQYFWHIEKTVDPGVIFADGTEYTVLYTILVDLAATPFVDGNYAVSGEIEIANTHPTRAATLTGVTDIITPGNIAATVDCPSMIVPAGDSIVCTYSATLPDDATRLNTATATLQNVEFDSDGNVVSFGTTDFSGTATIDFDGVDPELIDECADITDTNPDFAALFDIPQVCFDDTLPATFNYSKSFTLEDDQLVCDAFEHINIATATPIDIGPPVSDDAVVICGGIGGGPDDFEGCTPGFWRGGNGSQLWDTSPDDQWSEVCDGDPPFTHDTLFNDYFTPHASLNGLTMFDLVSSGGGGNVVRRAARSLVAAYLNASCSGVNYELSTTELEQLWDDGNFAALHTMLDDLNNLECPL